MSFRRHYKDLYILWSLFLIYIKSNHIISTVKQLAADVYYFSLLYTRTLAGKLNPGLKANLNRHLSMCHAFQIRIMLKKLCLHGKWQDHFIWMINWIYITIFSEKFQNQWKEQTNNKALLTFFHYTRPHLEYCYQVLVKNKLGSQIIL